MKTMAQRLLVLVTLVIALGAIFGAQSATAAYWTDCGKVGGYYGPSAIAHGVLCPKSPFQKEVPRNRQRIHNA